jgi:DNA-binding winged helix-turn-helix (wHTH) protein
MSDCRNSQPRDVLSFGPFSLFAAERLLKKADKPTALGGRPLDILIALVERAGEVVTNKELISAVWLDVVVEKGNLRFQWLPFGRRSTRVITRLLSQSGSALAR